MRKILILIILTIGIAACDGDDEAPEDLSVADAQSTAASQADDGEEPVVVFQRAAEGPETLQEWRIFAGGRVVVLSAAPAGAPAADVVVKETQVDAGAVDLLLQELESAGFYEAAEPGAQRWNDTLDYVVSVRVDGEWQSMVIEEVTPQTSVPRLQSLGVVERFLFEEVEGGQALNASTLV